MSDCQCVTIQQSNVSPVSTFQVDAHRLWTSSLKYRGLHDNKSHKLWNLSLDHKKKNLKAEGKSERLMGWPGWYWSKVHFNCVCPQSPAGHTDYDETICESTIDRAGVVGGHINLWGLVDEQVWFPPPTPHMIQDTHSSHQFATDCPLAPVTSKERSEM